MTDRPIRTLFAVENLGISFAFAAGGCPTMSTPIPDDHTMPDLDVDPRTAEALRRAEVQLRQTLKMEAVGRLAGGIAHDVNNLMTVVTGYAELLMEEFQDRPRLHQMTTEVKRAADRGTNIARQLLAFSRKQMLSPTIVSLSETILSMERTLAGIVGEDVELVCAPSYEPCRVYVDAAQIEQVLVNLATNAREAMPGGGRLSVSVSQVELNTAGAVRGPEMPQGPYVALRISDTVRHGSGDPGQDLRAVLHDEASRPGTRASAWPPCTAP